jgi:uncharacterized GH25 family protein
MNRKLIGGLLALVIAAVAVWFLWLRDRGSTTAKPDATANQGRSGQVPTDKPTTPTRSAHISALAGRSAKWTLDVDPDGPLQLEGQVLGPDGKGVAKAKVTLSSSPKRIAMSEDDGTFTFDKLVGRPYTLSATSGDLVGSLRFKLTATSGPAVIHVTEGAGLDVTVLDEPGKPIAGASVYSDDGDADDAVTTDAAGKAKLKGLRPGWIAIEATASGYAPNRTVTTVGSGGATGTVQITLRKGVAVSGRVVDDTGKAIANAKVSAASENWGMGDETGEADVITNAQGAFTIPSLAAGTHRLTAIDGEHAPAWSTPITVKDAPVSGVTITMKAGGTLAGKVTDTAGKPVAFASVQVLGKGQDAWMQEDPRRATTDKLGAFELRGLARIKLQARAESETAASKIVDVDLAEKAAITDLALVLEVSGQIAGIVVDEKGAPVPEVQVNAFPDILGGASADGLALAGMSSTTTDGGGAFVISGLPDGAYRLRAARARPGWGDWGQGGTEAKPGDKDVKVVLPAPGELKGKVVIAKGGDNIVPTIASVQVGQNPPTPVTKGEFTVRGVIPGSYDVTFRGLEFAQLQKRDVKIEPGKTTDLGTVTVQRGRQLVGKVVDPNGKPVSGARVRVGEMLFSGNDDDTNRNEGLEELYGMRSASSDQAGEFVINGVSSKATSMLAEHPDLGRSAATQIPAGSDDVPAITLALRGYGSISGVVTMKGKPLAKVNVGASAKGGGATAVFATTDDEGKYTIAKVAEGEQIVQAMKTGMMEMKTGKTTAVVVAGQQVVANIEIPVGEIALTVNLKALPNHKLDGAQVFLYSGMVAISTGKQLTDTMFSGGAQGMKLWLGKNLPMPVFEELVAGDYSMCSIPITGDLSDTTFGARLQENIPTLKVYCKSIKVKPSPNAQAVTHDLPSMTPLPDPTN